MFAAAEELRFEQAAALRDEIKALRQELEAREAGAAAPGDPDAPEPGPAGGASGAEGPRRAPPPLVPSKPGARRGRRRR